MNLISQVVLFHPVVNSAETGVSCLPEINAPVASIQTFKKYPLYLNSLEIPTPSGKPLQKVNFHAFSSVHMHTMSTATV